MRWCEACDARWWWCAMCGGGCMRWGECMCPFIWMVMLVRMMMFNDDGDGIDGGTGDGVRQW